MKQENLLIVCFDIKDFRHIKKIDLSNYGKLIVASDDFRVHEECSSIEYIDDVTFLQKNIPFTTVSKDVINIIEKANLFYQEVENNFKLFKKEYMQLPFQVEGGDFTQKIQDLLLYIESLNIIFKSFEINEVILIKDNNKFVSDIIKRYTQDKKLKFTLLNKNHFNITKKDIKYKIRPFYYLAKTIYIKSLFIFENKRQEKNVSLVWLFSNVKKHIDNSILLDSFMKQAKYNNILYSWRIDKTSDSRLDKTINLERIEKYVSWLDIFKSVLLNIKTIIHLNKLNRLFKNFDFSYKDINLNSFINSIVVDYILIESSDTYRFSKGFEDFNKSIELKLVGGDLSRQKLGKAVESIISVDDIAKYMFSIFSMPKNDYVKDSRRRYSDKYWDNLVFFVQNENDKSIVVNEVAKLESKAFIYGSFRGSGELFETKNEAKKLYNIASDYSHYILYDFSSPLFGYGSLEEILKVLNILVDYVKNNKETYLIIKPHPSADLNTVNTSRDNIGLENCKFLKREDNVNYALALSDIVVTKYSTIGIEAMKCDSLVISYQLDETDAFKLYGENGNYVNSYEELKNELDKILKNDEYKSMKLDKQKEFYKKNFSKEVDYDIVVNNLSSFISKKVIA